MFRKSEGVNRMREKKYILKGMTWQSPIGWRKILVLC